MLFLASKFLWIALLPGNLLVILLAIGVLSLWLTRGRSGRLVVTAVTLAFLAFIALPVGQWAIAPLESRFPQPSLPDRVDGIVLLGGAVDTGITAAHGQVALDDAAERVTSSLALARRFPSAKVLISGGNAEMIEKPLLEAEATRTLLVQLGLDESRILVEDRSRNTYDNAVDSKEVAQPKPGEIWLLVTSAEHMTRAVGCFREVGWQVVPYPVDYHTGIALTPDAFTLSRNLGIFELAMHEWVGLVAYRLLGRTDALFPGPQVEAIPGSASSAR